MKPTSYVSSKLIKSIQNPNQVNAAMLGGDMVFLMFSRFPSLDYI